MTTDYTATKTNPRQTPHLIISLWITIILCFISSVSYSIFNTPIVHAEEYDLTSVTHRKLNDAEKGNIVPQFKQVSKIFKEMIQKSAFYLAPAIRLF